MSQSGNAFADILVPLALDSSNEEEILLSLPHLVRGMEGSGRLRLYHVVTPAQLRWGLLEGESFLQQVEHLHRRAEDQLARYCELLRAQIPSSWQVDYEVEAQEVASPGEEIALYLQREKFGLLVLAFKQRKRWERFFGATALWDILESVSLPVLVLPAPLSIAPRRLLWMTDMQREEFSVLHVLVPFTRALRGTLYCVKVNTPYAFYSHRTFQRHILAMCDYILEQVDPDFVPEECLLYADKDPVEGVAHAAQDFLMDVVVLSDEPEKVDWKVLDALLSQQLPVLLLRKG